MYYIGCVFNVVLKVRFIFNWYIGYYNQILNNIHVK